MTEDRSEPRRPLALVVDDATTVRMYHRGLIEEAGWDVIEAENGMEALERVIGQPVEVMFVDVNMPVMDGYRFIAAARSSETLGQVPAVMISTEAQVLDSDKAFAAGANHYLVKPARPGDLRALLALLAPEVPA
ncbi:response regulator [Pseudooceanicola sp. CBS1P-1]|uniref:Response regulator n=1 Tax=Pseudooceanicola albus TaxID=2692189 RepID=A0A6L7G9F4_9RHOB|nr:MULTISPECIES: response regulator [Pseudooceanicola]MBT9382849.1 response regulator [Pseudooceanicola endophyticus]MXN20227.1 response regulator [Pseudooceanicola albus]